MSKKSKKAYTKWKHLLCFMLAVAMLGSSMDMSYVRAAQISDTNSIDEKATEKSWVSDRC